jgi:hypothetical protein
MYDIPDPVFPFLSGYVVYLVFTLVLLLYAVLCLFVGFIASFVARHCVAAATFLLFSVTWYRASLAILGVTECRCLGILGRAFSLTESQELLCRALLLIFLCMPLIEAAASSSLAFLRRRFRAGLQYGLLAVAPLTSRGEGTIHLEGDYSLRAQNPLTGAVYADLSSKGIFAVHLSGDCYKFCLTNSGNGWMTGAWYDGKTLCYYDIPNDHPGSGIIFADHGNWLVGGPRNNIPSYLLWLMYGISAASLTNVALDDRALPWDQPRYNITAYGYRWDFDWLKNGRHSRTARAYRDHSLDLPTYKDELLRPTMVFPLKIDQQRQRRIDLEYCRKTVPNGLLAGEYQCIRFTNLQEMTRPLQGALTVYFHDAGVSQGSNYPAPYLNADAVVKSVFIDDEPINYGIQTPRHHPINTWDSRLRQITNNRYFEGARYETRSGDQVRAAEHPDNVAQREKARTQGPEIRWGGQTPVHIYLWLALMLFMLGFVAWLRQSS